MSLDLTTQFAEQVTVNQLVQNVVYASGAISAPFVAGTPRGGWLGIEEGPYAFQHGKISLMMQLVGAVACIGTGVVTSFMLAI